MTEEQLSAIRTHLANERTALSYIRTALTFVAAGAGLIYFIPSSYLLVWWGLIVIGLGVLIGGVIRYLSVRRRISKLFS
jgi:putative membrane protein